MEWKTDLKCFCLFSGLFYSCRLNYTRQALLSCEQWRHWFGLCAFLAGQLANVSTYIIAFTKSSISFIGFELPSFCILFFGFSMDCTSMKIFLFGVISSNADSRTQTFERTLDCTCGACPHGVCSLALKHNVVQLFGFGALRLSRATLRHLPVWVELILLLLCQNVHVQMSPSPTTDPV